MYAPTIFKYKLKDSLTISLPHGAIVRHVGMQNGEIHLWIEVDQRTVLREDRRFFYLGTGHSIPEGAAYLGTVHETPHVWHVFEAEAERKVYNFVDSPDHCACGEYAPNAKHRGAGGHVICDLCAKLIGE